MFITEKRLKELIKEEISFSRRGYEIAELINSFHKTKTEREAKIRHIKILELLAEEYGLTIAIADQDGLVKTSSSCSFQDQHA